MLCYYKSHVEICSKLTDYQNVQFIASKQENVVNW